MRKLRVSAVFVVAGFFTAAALGMLDPEPSGIVGWLLLLFYCYVIGALVLLGAGAVLLLAGGSVTWPWDDRALGSTPAVRAGKTDPVKEAQTVVHAYSHLVSESGTRLPESALPYSKDVIRRSLLLWAALEPDTNVRDNLCSIYGLLEDFLPHDDWLVLNEWDRIIKTQDTDALFKAEKQFSERAVGLMKETTARVADRMDEFRRKLAQLDDVYRPTN